MPPGEDASRLLGAVGNSARGEPLDAPVAPPQQTPIGRACLNNTLGLAVVAMVMPPILLLDFLKQGTVGPHSLAGLHIPLKK
jgi:hypothetical protein